MEYTQNYQLPLWDKEDAIKRTDFNDVNSKIDNALGMLANASGGHGNCKIEYGSYIGTGTCGSESPKTLDFSSRPILVMIFQLNNGYINIMGNPSKFGAFLKYNGNASGGVLTWSSTGVTWYANTVETQMNESNTNYTYLALLAADE